MPKKRYSENQILTILKEHEAGVLIKELCRQHGMAEQTFYNWKAKYSGLDRQGIRKLRLLQEENARLKRLVATQALKEVLLDNLKRRRFVCDKGQFQMPHKAAK